MKIVAPVMRFVGTADLRRATAFYRDVLGFEIREGHGNAEALLGPARLQFGEYDHPPNDWDHPQPPGTAWIYFETVSLASTRDEIVARGGQPSTIGKLNWVKLSVFTLRDPDGHTICVGESYNFPDPSKPDPMFEKALPWLPVKDVAAAVQYYCDVLGFKINYHQEDLGVMDRDRITLLLVPRGEKSAGSASFYIRNADELHAEFLAKGANIQCAPVSEPWGLRTFEILDLDGNQLSFGQRFE